MTQAPLKDATPGCLGWLGDPRLCGTIGADVVPWHKAFLQYKMLVVW